MLLAIRTFLLCIAATSLLHAPAVIHWAGLGHGLFSHSLRALVVAVYLRTVRRNELKEGQKSDWAIVGFFATLDFIGVASGGLFKPAGTLEDISQS